MLVRGSVIKRRIQVASRVLGIKASINNGTIVGTVPQYHKQ